MRVDLPGGDVRRAAQLDVEEPLVVPDIQVGLRAVIGDEHLAVLERVHRAGIDVEVRVELLHADPQSPQLEQPPETRGSKALAEAGRPAPGDEEMLGGNWP